jgi:hypothetical protein
VLGSIFLAAGLFSGREWVQRPALGYSVRRP